MHLSLPKQFPLFILTSSVCWSLQRPISALTQGARWWSRFLRLACSVVLWGGRDTAKKSHWRALTVIQPHWVCPAHGVCAFPIYTAQTLGCSARNCLMRALVYMHFPGLSCSGSGSWVQRCRLGWACVLHLSQVRAAQVTRCLARAVNPS